MKLNEAIDILRKEGYIVNRYNKGYLVSWAKEAMRSGSPSGPEYVLDRTLIKWAEGCRNKFWTGKKKKKRHYKNRAKTKENIAKEKFENFHKNTLAADSNPWDFD